MMATIRTILDICVCFAVNVLVLSILSGYIPTFKQGFYCDDPSIRYKYRGDTVKNNVLVRTMFPVPFFLIFLTEICNHWKCFSDKSFLRDAWRSTFHYYFIFMRGLVINGAVSVFTSALVGEPRPHFLDTCKPDFTKINCSEGYITDYTCMGHMTRQEIGQLHGSFISGHASYSMYTSLFLCFYIYKNISLYPTYFVAWMFQVFFLVLALFCGTSRVTDKRHHWWNVVIGCLVGIICAFYAATKLYIFQSCSTSKSAVRCDSKLRNDSVQMC